MCPLLAPVLIGLFFLLQPLTVLMKQTSQAVFTVKQFILLRCLWVLLYCFYCRNAQGAKASTKLEQEPYYFHKVLQGHFASVNAQCPHLFHIRNKLECLSVAGLFSLV
jgi:hypothetical protein